MGKFSNKVPGICDRCGLRFRLKTLREEDILGKRTGLLVCPRCYDQSHPQLDTRNLRTDDKQSVRNARSDTPELEQGRKLFAWRPVGNTGSTEVTVRSGKVKVVIS